MLLSLSTGFELSASTVLSVLSHSLLRLPGLDFTTRRWLGIPQICHPDLVFLGGSPIRPGVIKALTRAQQGPLACACARRDADEAMLVQAIQASLIDAGKGHDVQPASAGTGSTSNVQVAAGPALPSCYMRCLSPCLCACSMTSSEAACSTCACVALTLVT